MTKEPRDMTWRELINEAVAERGDTGKEIICTLPIEVLDKEVNCNDENWTAWCGDWIYTPGWEFEVNPYVYASRRNPDSEKQHTKWASSKIKEDKKIPSQIIHRTCCEVCGNDATWGLFLVADISQLILNHEEYKQKQQEGVEWVFVRKDDYSDEYDFENLEWVEKIN